MGPKTARDRVLHIDDIINQLLKERKKVIEELQDNCLHESFLQTKVLYKHRVCLFCGKIEYEKESNFFFIKGEPVQEIEEAQFFKLVDLPPLELAAQFKKIVGLSQPSTKNLEENKQ